MITKLPDFFFKVTKMKWLLNHRWAIYTVFDQKENPSLMYEHFDI